MAVASINLTLDNDILEKIDIIAKKEEKSRSELINNSIKRYIDQKQKLQELYAYGESISSKNNFSEDDIMEEIRIYRKSKWK